MKSSAPPLRARALLSSAILVLLGTSSRARADEPTGAPAQAPAPAAPAQSTAPVPAGSTTASSVLHTAGYVGIGAGVGGIFIGIMTGLLATSKKTDLTELCGPSLECPPQYASELDAYHTARTVTAIGLVAGGAVALAGVTLVFVTSRQNSARASAFIGPATAGVTGVF